MICTGAKIMYFTQNGKDFLFYTLYDTFIGKAIESTVSHHYMVKEGDIERACSLFKHFSIFHIIDPGTGIP